MLNICCNRAATGTIIVIELINQEGIISSKKLNWAWNKNNYRLLIVKIITILSSDNYTQTDKNTK